MDFAYYILTPFSWLLQFFYDLTGSYGFALILFAVVVKLILFPFSLKGKKSMIQMNMLQGKMQQIQRKYANDKQRQNLEIQKLYEKEKVNPMGGCLWSLLPIFILLPLYAIIRQPMKYMMGLDETQITTLIDVLNQYAATAIDPSKNVYYQLIASNVLFENFDAVVANPAVAAFADNLKQLDFSFLGLALSTVPTWKIWAGPFNWNAIGTFLIPIVSACTGLLFSVISMRTNQLNKNQPENEQAKTTSRTMMIMSPVISLWVGYSMPAAMSIYWVSNNVLSLVQELLAGRILKKDYEAAAAARAEQERLEKEEEKQRRREAAERKAQAIADAKANRGKKKAKPAEEKKKSDASVIDVSRVGIRSYARGRAYDPYRYSPDGPTPYKDPGAPVDETAVEKALEKKSDHLQAVAAEGVADELIVNEILEENAAADAAAETTETVESAAADAGDAADVQDPWAGIDAEVEAINAETQDKDKE
ncbi:YidC/Oxa1 family membrane protein insertase [uncultured Intestinimonas sp.]|uniref:YidC/Oxa1 family membrane protein insertase n=1 Tax=uncultured Intestinimonas sp. TaxID=1689265 RepID=UPI0025E12935|nr:YidC/Oxa1 family membrane protein insertase [uncultured Intestinimonas sp.]